MHSALHSSHSFIAICDALYFAAFNPCTLHVACTVFIGPHCLHIQIEFNIYIVSRMSVTRTGNTKSCKFSFLYCLLRALDKLSVANGFYYYYHCYDYKLLQNPKKHICPLSSVSATHFNKKKTNGKIENEKIACKNPHPHYCR